MTGDLPAAALRLAAALPVRTHVRENYIHLLGSKVSRRVKIDGREFESRVAAKKHFHIGTETLTKWLLSGRAVQL